MRILCKILWFAIVCFTLSISQSFCQIEKFDIAFPYHGALTKFKKDKDGYLWFHDDKDYYRYNGHQITAVGIDKIIGKEKDDYLLLGEIIFFEDRILFLNDNKLSLVHPRTKEVQDLWELPGRDYFKYLYQDELNNIWLFTSTWDNKHQPVYKSTNGRDFVEMFDLNEYVGDQGVFWTYYELDDKDGNLFFLWRMGGVTIINSEGKETHLDVANQESFLQTKDCAQFRLDNRKNLWRIYEKHFQIFNWETRSFEDQKISGKIEFKTTCKINAENENKRVGLQEVGTMLSLRFLHVDDAERIWMGCAASYLVCYDPTIDQFLNFRKSIISGLEGSDSDIYNMTQDEFGNLWAHKDGGIFKIREKTNYFESHLNNTKDKNHPIYQQVNNPGLDKILNYYNDFAIRNSSIHSVNEDGKGGLILQESFFTHQLDLKTKEIKTLPIFSPMESVHMSFNDNLKVYSTWNSYYSLDENFKARKMKTPILAIENTLVQKNGAVWYSGLLNKKSYLFGKADKNNFELLKNYEDPAGNINFSINKVQSMTEDTEGNIWLGTLKGIVYFNVSENSFKYYNTEFEYQNKKISLGTETKELKFIGENQLWFRTSNEVGLINIEEKTLAHYLALNVVTNDQISKMIPFGDSLLWLAYESGIAFHNFNQQKSGNFSVQEGIETNGSVRAFVKLSNGQIAVGSNNGLYIFNPDNLIRKYSSKQNDLKNIKIKIDDYSILKGKSNELIQHQFLKDDIEQINLKYNDKMLEMTYAYLNFDYPDRHRFSYKMEGYDYDWSSPSIKNTARYTSLPPGKYNFKVKATSGSGIWSDEMLNVPVNVKQAWFRTWWFILLFISTIGILIYLSTRYYYQQKIEKQIAIEKLRNKISRDIHDDVGSMLAGVAMKSELLSMKFKHESQRQLLEISEKTRAAMGKMRDIVWALNSTRDKYENLVDRMHEFATSQFNYAPLDYHMTLENIDRKQFISPEIRQNIYMIFKEAITNAIKHSNGDRVDIYFINKKNKIILSIKDNGSYTAKVNKEGLGMSTMKIRSAMMGANFFIDQSDGFEVRIEIPIK